MPGGLTNSDGIPALERLVQFTGQRHRLILNNIANLSTPGFRPSDVSPQAFQAQLAEAIDASRSAAPAPAQDLFELDPGEGGDDTAPFVAMPPGSALGIDAPAPGAVTGAESALPLRSTREVEAMHDRLVLHPEPTGDNILFHDGNDRSVERVMQSLVENFMAFRTAAQLLRNRLDIINTAIRERI
jgi:flagellar basal body rod protein FlgB